MSFYNGILNLTNWGGNVILPTLAGLFIAIAIIQFSKGKEYSYAMYGGFLCLMASGLLRAFETFASQRARPSCHARSRRKKLVGKFKRFRTVQVHVHQAAACLSKNDADVAGAVEVPGQVCFREAKLFPTVLVRPFDAGRDIDRHPPTAQVVSGGVE